MKKIKVFLYFPPDKTDKPIVYYLVKDYDIIFNILQAEIEPSKRGRLTIELEGTEENLQKGLEFIESQGVKYRIFNKNIIWNEDNCVHCGACTAVCPSQALSLNREDWSLNFDQSKCLVCEECIKACPMKAIDVDIFI